MLQEVHGGGGGLTCANANAPFSSAHPRLGASGILNTTVTFDSSINWTKVWTVASAFVVLVPTVSYRTLGENRILSLAGALATVLTVLVVLVFSIYLYPLTPEHANMDDDGYVFDKPTHKIVDLKLMPEAFSAIVLSFGGAATFPTIEDNMEKPAKFAKVLNKSFLTLVLLYLVTATAGYYTFGDITFSPILCNLPRGDDFSGRLVQCTKLFVAFHVTTAYPILMSSLVTEVECKFPFFRSPIPRTIERVGFVAATAIVAVYVPFFGELMTFVGAGCLTMIVFVFPVVFNFKLRNMKGQKIHTWEKAAGATVVILAGLGGGIGVYQATGDLVNAIKG